MKTNSGWAVMPWFNRWKTITETLTLSLARIPFWCFSLSPRTQVVGSYKRRFNSIWKGKKPQRATFHAHIRIHLYFDERITSIKSCLFLNSVRYLHLKYRHTHIQSVTLNWKDIFEAIEGEWINEDEIRPKTLILFDSPAKWVNISWECLN